MWLKTLTPANALHRLRYNAPRVLKRSLATRVESSLRSRCSYPDPRLNSLSSLSSHISTGATATYRAYRGFRALFCTRTNSEDRAEILPRRRQGSRRSKRTRVSRYKACICPIRVAAPANVWSSGGGFLRFLRTLRTFLQGEERRGPRVATQHNRQSSRLSINQRHHFFVITWTGNSLRRQSTIELRHLLRCQLYPGSSNVLFQIGAPFRPGDGNDIVALKQQPRQSNLPRRRLLALGNVLHHRSRAHV